jgi:putative nucleotidyltransferase with HDIG domain
MLLNNNIDIDVTLEEFTKSWQVLVETLPYAIFLIDTNCNVVMSNNAATELMAGEEDFTSAKCYQFLHNADSPPEPHIGKYLAITTAPVINKGTIIGIIHSVLDVTEQKESEIASNDLIEIYASAINDLKARVVRAQEGRDAFLNMLEDINESYKELEDLFLKLILVMVNALDTKSPWTKGHSERVALYAEQIARKMLIDEDEIKEIKLAGLLHDIGKIGTYDYLLDKPGRLTEEEFDIVKKHPEQGADILQEIKQLRDVIPFIQYHHEKLDGNGYPHKLKGVEIPLGARILHVADSFDSMTSDRPYRPSPGITYALSELEKFKGIQFDHQVVDAFLKVLEDSDQWVTNLPSG